MTTYPPFPGFDGLLMLSRREGVDIRPTLLRVLTDLYVQTLNHTAEEEQQYIELAYRLIDEVDDATLAAVRARLSIYPKTPSVIADKLALHSSERQPLSSNFDIQPRYIPPQRYGEESAPPRTATELMQPLEATELNDIFFAADTRERRLILENLSKAPRQTAVHIEESTAQHAIAALDRMALEADLIGFTYELAHALTLQPHMAQQITNDPGGEALACALKALGMPEHVFQHVLLFLDPELGASINRVYTLARFYETLSKHAALVLLAAWRGAYTAPRARHRPLLHDEERQRARPAQSRLQSPSFNTTQAPNPFPRRGSNT
jgi:hypothetical protein